MSESFSSAGWPFTWVNAVSHSNNFETESLLKHDEYRKEMVFFIWQRRATSTHPHTYSSNDGAHFLFHWKFLFFYFSMWHILFGSFSASIGKTHSTATNISHWKCLIKKFLRLQVQFNTRQIKLVERSHFTQHLSSLLHIFILQTEHEEQSKTITFPRVKERASGKKYIAFHLQSFVRWKCDSICDLINVQKLITILFVKLEMSSLLFIDSPFNRYKSICCADNIIKYCEHFCESCARFK